MENLFKGALLLVMVALPPLLYAQDSYDEKEWSTYVMDLSGKRSVPENLNNIKRSGFYYIHNIQQIREKWLRVSASSDITGEDFDISIVPYKNFQNINGQYFPSSCAPLNGKKVCSNIIRLPSSASHISIVFSWPKKSLVTPENIRYHIAEDSIVTLENKNRYEEWTDLLKQKYYRSKEVDWATVHAAGLSSLAAPSGIDPLPRALWELINQLPEHRETQLFSVGTRTISKEEEPRIYPTCIQINDLTWRLDLPATYTAIGNKWYGSNQKEYIARAHECLLQPGAAKWIVNLTEQTAGNIHTVIAALAPLLGNTSNLYRKNAAGELKTLNLNNVGIGSNGQAYTSRPIVIPPYNGQADFIVDKHCGEHLCGDIVMTIKGNGRLLGQASATPSVSNELFVINKEIQLQLTTHWLTDSEGKIFTQIQPDVLLNEQGIEKALLGELK